MMDRDVKAICVKEPWASMEVDGFKSAEIKSSRTKHRGELLICASRVPDFGALNTWMVYAAKIPVYRLGMAIGFVWIEDCVPYTQELEMRGRIKANGDKWAWLLDPKKARFIEPFAVKGRLGLFDVRYREIGEIQ